MINTPHPLPSTETLYDTFSLDPLTGTLYWLISPAKRCAVGSIAGSFDGEYFKVKLKGINYRLHRLIYKWVTGQEPGVCVEHLDDDPKNNCSWNLKDSTMQQNTITRYKNATTK